MSAGQGVEQDGDADSCGDVDEAGDLEAFAGFDPLEAIFSAQELDCDPGSFAGGFGQATEHLGLVEGFALLVPAPNKAGEWDEDYERADSADGEKEPQPHVAEYRDLRAFDEMQCEVSHESPRGSCCFPFSRSKSGGG